VKISSVLYHVNVQSLAHSAFHRLEIIVLLLH